jgi:ribosomal protein L37E
MIRCPKCGRVSYHPKDEEHRYCGACHQFHDTMKETETSPSDRREKTLEMLMRWRDDEMQCAGVYKLTEMIFSSVEKHPEAAQLCRDMVEQAESNAKRMEKIIIGYKAPKP